MVLVEDIKNQKSYVEENGELTVEAERRVDMLGIADQTGRLMEELPQPYRSNPLTSEELQKRRAKLKCGRSKLRNEIIFDHDCDEIINAEKYSDAENLG